MKHWAFVLGWCVELLQASFLVADDIMDNSETRRGLPCWYRVEGVGTSAINDSGFLESLVYRILRRTFREQSFYTQLADLFHETTHQTRIGQMADLETAVPGTAGLEARFTPDRYLYIVKYKTAHYSFYLPVALGLTLSGIADPGTLQSAKEILLLIGEYFQVQDDFLDCYGDPQQTGKVGTDIAEGKCTWLVVQALKHASRPQLDRLNEIYGGEHSADQVKAIYQEMGIADIYSEYEEQSHRDIVAAIDAMETPLPKSIFYMQVEKLRKRKK